MNTLRTITIALLALLTEVNAFAATYHVKKSTGSDANPGSEGSPWATITKAFSTAVAGDIVFIHGPDYYLETPTTGASGTADTNRIVFIGTNDMRFGMININKDFLTFKNWGWVGPTNASVPYSGGMTLQSGSDDITIDGFYTQSNRASVFPITTQSGTTSTRLRIINSWFTNQTREAVLVGGYQHTVSNCWFGGTNGFDAIQWFVSNGRISNNTFTNLGRPSGSSAHVDIVQAHTTGGANTHWTNNWFENNLAINCTEGCQIGNIEQQSWSSATNAVRDWYFVNNRFIRISNPMNVYGTNFWFFNNLFYECNSTNRIGEGGPGGGTGIGPINWYYDASKGVSGGAMSNNLFVRCGNVPTNASLHGYLMSGNTGGTSNVTVGNNLVIGLAPHFTKTMSYIAASDKNGVDPAFVNESVFNWSLQSTSVAINAAMDLSALFTVDAAGVTRSAGAWAIGPYEYVSGGPTPPPSYKPKTFKRFAF